MRSYRQAARARARTLTEEGPAVLALLNRTGIEDGAASLRPQALDGRRTRGIHSCWAFANLRNSSVFRSDTAQNVMPSLAQWVMLYPWRAAISSLVFPVLFEGQM